MAGNRQASQAVTVDGHLIERTSSSKMVSGNTVVEDELVEYYLAAADATLPHMQDRPVVMMRYPDGINGPRIVQKYIPDWIRQRSCE